MYPNSVYEFNVKRQHISDAIINCYNIKHNLQLMIRFFPANMKKYIPYVKEIDTEVEMLKRWRKNYTTKMKNYCYNKDEMTKRTAARAIDKSEAKATVKLQTNITLLDQIIGISYTQAQLYENYRNTQFYYDQNNRYCSTNYIAAMTYYDKNGFFIGDSAHDFRE